MNNDCILPEELLNYYDKWKRTNIKISEIKERKRKPIENTNDEGEVIFETFEDISTATPKKNIYSKLDEVSEKILGEKKEVADSIIKPMKLLNTVFDNLKSSKSNLVKNIADQLVESSQKSNGITKSFEYIKTSYSKPKNTELTINFQNLTNHFKKNVSIDEIEELAEIIDTLPLYKDKLSTNGFHKQKSTPGVSKVLDIDDFLYKVYNKLNIDYINNTNKTLNLIKEKQPKLYDYLQSTKKMNDEIFEDLKKIGKANDENYLPYYSSNNLDPDSMIDLYRKLGGNKTAIRKIAMMLNQSSFIKGMKIEKPSINNTDLKNVSESYKKLLSKNEQLIEKIINYKATGSQTKNDLDFMREIKNDLDRIYDEYVPNKEDILDTSSKIENKLEAKGKSRLYIDRDKIFTFSEEGKDVLQFTLNTNDLFSKDYLGSQILNIENNAFKITSFKNRLNLKGKDYDISIKSQRDDFISELYKSDKSITNEDITNIKNVFNYLEKHGVKENMGELGSFENNTKNILGAFRNLQVFNLMGLTPLLQWIEISVGIVNTGFLSTFKYIGIGKKILNDIKSGNLDEEYKEVLDVFLNFSDENVNRTYKDIIYEEDSITKSMNFFQKTKEVTGKAGQFITNNPYIPLLNMSFLNSTSRILFAHGLVEDISKNFAKYSNDRINNILGLSNEEFEKITNLIISTKKNGKVDKDFFIGIKDWPNEEKELFKFMLHNHSNHILLNRTIGTSVPFLSENTIGKTGLQFMEYAIKAYKIQGRRVITGNIDKREIAAIAGSIATGYFSYMARVYSTYSDDKEKLEKALDPEIMVMNILKYNPYIGLQTDYLFEEVYEEIFEDYKEKVTYSGFGRDLASSITTSNPTAGWVKSIGLLSDEVINDIYNDTDEDYLDSRTLKNIKRTLGTNLPFTNQLLNIIATDK